MPNPSLSTSTHKSKADKEQKPLKSKTKKSFFKGVFSLKRFKEIAISERYQRVFGLFLILFSVLLLISFTSFLFTWQSDFDKVDAGWWSLIFDGDLSVDNWLGKFGALISHFFIYQLFGIASFSFVLMAFLLGFKIIFKIYLLPFGATLKHSLFFLLWLSTLCSFLFYEHGSLLFLGGGFGFLSSTYLQEILGGIGTAFVLLFLAASYVLLNFKVNFAMFDLLLNKKSPHREAPNESGQPSNERVHSEADTLQNEDENIQEEEKSESESDAFFEIDFEDDEPSNHEEKEFDSEPKIEVNDDFDVVKPAENEEAETAEDDLELDVAEAAEEEILSKNEIKSLVDEFGAYDPTLDLSKYKFPDINILVNHGDGKVQVNREELEANKNNIVDTLRNYNIEIEKIKATIGPTVTLYEIVPAKGVRISKIKNLEDDIALSLAALGIRIIAPIPGKGTIGIEVPNQNPDIVAMKTVISSEKFQHSTFDLPVAIGKTIQNEIFVADLARMPHLLMAGATGQGKSVGLNAILVSLLYKKHPAQIKFVLVDPKKVELTLFNKIERHFLAKLPGEEEAIITDTSKVVKTLNSLCIEMDQRYELLKNAAVRTIKEYNQKFINRKLNPENGHRYLPYIVLVVDEFADLIMTAGKEVETPIARLAQLARAIGIHLIIATQRPSVNIITGTIKANFPSRIAFRVTSKIDSRTILDASGADQLIGRGDMLFSNGNELIRLQCPFVDTPEVEEICEFIGNQQGYPDAFILPEYIDENAENMGMLEDIERDALFEEAARMVVLHQQGSASLLQRKLKLGYNRAGRIVDQLEAAGIIGPFEGSKARQVLISDEMSLEHLLKRSENE